MTFADSSGLSILDSVLMTADIQYVHLTPYRLTLTPLFSTHSLPVHTHSTFQYSLLFTSHSLRAPYSSLLTLDFSLPTSQFITFLILQFSLHIYYTSHFALHFVHIILTLCFSLLTGHISLNHTPYCSVLTAYTLLFTAHSSFLISLFSLTISLSSLVTRSYTHSYQTLLYFELIGR